MLPSKLFPAAILVLSLSAITASALPPPYHPPANNYRPPPHNYNPPANNYHPPTNNYNPPPYHPPANNYRPPTNNYDPPSGNNNYYQQQARENAANAARENAARVARENAANAARENAANVARENAARVARENAANTARDNAARVARENAANVARENSARAARENAANTARENAARVARENAANAARENAARAARENAANTARENAARVARENAANAARENAARVTRENAENAARENAARVARENAANAARENAARVTRENAENAARVARDNQNRLAQRQRSEKAVLARVGELKAPQRAQFDKLQESMKQKQAALRVAKPVGAGTTLEKGKPQPSTVKPSLSRSGLAQTLSGKARSNPKLATAVDKLTGKNTQPLKKSDLATLKKNLPLEQGAKFSLTQPQFTTVAQMANNANDPRLKDAMTRYLQYGPAGMSQQDVALIQADLAQSARFPGQANRVGALAAVLAETRDYQNAQQALVSLQNQNAGSGKGGNILGSFLGAAGGALVGTLLSGGGVLGGYPGGAGGFYPGGGDYYPPEVPTLFYPSDPNVTIDPDDAYPSVSGVSLAVTNPPYLDATESGAGPDGDPIQLESGEQAARFAEVADLAYDAAPWQTTRYLRVGNAAGEKVVVYIRFLAETGPDTTVWLPAEPDDSSNQWAVFELEPGESADLKQDDWQVNARKACIWARSGSLEWNQFRTRPLDLVSDVQYQSPAPQVFNFTVN